MDGIDLPSLVEDSRFVRLAVARGILENEDTVSFRSLVSMSPVVHNLTDPHATEVVDVDAGGAQHHGLGGEESSLQSVSDIEICDCFLRRLLARGKGGEGRNGGTDRESGSDA